MPSNPDNRKDQERAREELYRRFSTRGLWRQRFRRLIRGLTWVLIVQLLSGAKRALDLVTAFALVLLLSPILTVVSLLLGVKGTVLQRTPRAGRWCARFYEYAFITPDSAVGRILAKLHLHRLPVLLNVLKGDMSFVGPRPVSPGDLSPRERAVRKRYNVRPGLISLWWIRQRANIAYDTEVGADGEYVDTRSVRGDLGIALRAIPAVLYGEGVATVPDLVTILGIPINNLTMDEAVETIVDRASGDTPCQLCFVNADCANIAYHDEEYLRVLRSAELTLADGIGLKLAGKMLTQDIKQNVNGTDLFPRLCEALSDTGKGLFLLGARPGVVERVRDWLAEHYPEVIVSGCHHGYFSPEEEDDVIRRIADSGADLLLVAFGAPRQDSWIRQHLDKTGAKVATGVGGLFDFYSGRTARAPQWMREIGMEWLYRFYREPRRMWKRYFVGNAVFLFRVVKERIKHASPLSTDPTL